MIEIMAIFATGYVAARNWPWYTPFAIFALATPFSLLKAYIVNTRRTEDGLDPIPWTQSAQMLVVMLLLMLLIFFGGRWLSGRRG